MTPAITSLKQYIDLMAGMVASIQEDTTYFNGIYGLCATHGTSFHGPGEALTDEECALLESVTEWSGTGYAVKECFYNAQRLAAADPQGRILYWEGFATRIIVTHHAWVTINGKVIDLTWRLGAAKRNTAHALFADRNAVGTMPDHAAYIGVHIDASKALERMCEHGHCYSYLDDHTNDHLLLQRAEWDDYEAPR